MRNIKDYPPFKRPREKLMSRGAEALSDTELLAILLGSGSKKNNVFKVARAILQQLEKNDNKMEVNKLLGIEGIGNAKACQLMAAIEFARRRFLKNLTVIRKAEDLLPFISHIANKRQEYFLCIALNGAKEIISNQVVTIGLLNSSQIHPREVFADVISDRADAIILAHNHPSGTLKPSTEDIAVTNQMVEAGRILGISVLDHLIITTKGYFSFKENDLI